MKPTNFHVIILFLLTRLMLYPLNVLGQAQNYDEYDFKITYNPAFRMGEVYYKINSDSTTVCLKRTTLGGGYSYSGHKIKFSQPVANPDNGLEYIITSVGDGEHSLCIYDSEITPNVGRIEDYAFSAYTYNMTISTDCIFDYVGLRAISNWTPNFIRIADNGIFYLDNLLPQELILGKNVTIYYYSTGMYRYYWNNTNLSDLKIYSYSQKPPQIIPKRDNPDSVSTSFFDAYGDSLYRAEYMTVYVPYGCREAYKADPEWGKFENIREMRFDPASGIDDVVADEVLGISVVTGPSALRVSAPGRQTVSVYAITGMLVKRAETGDDGQATIELEAGAYIVKVGDGFVRKVVVR